MDFNLTTMDVPLAQMVVMQQEQALQYLQALQLY